jgi:insulysin
MLEFFLAIIFNRGAGKMGRILLGLICVLGCCTFSIKAHLYDVEFVDSCLLDSPTDRRLAKVILPNGLPVLVISDPNETRSSAAMSVAVGSFDDPWQYPGMAHFVEHLLFLGTKKYPDEGEYKRCVGDVGGSANASTKHDQTVFHFSVKGEFFEEILDRFSHFFIDPLLTTSAIEREKKAVHHEFEDEIEGAFFRVWRVLKETGNLDHANARFSCGNLESLESISREEIEEWFKKHYQPKHMRLVLVSPEPTHAIIDKACRYFSKIPKGDLAQRREPVHGLFSSRQKGHRIYIDSVLNERVLILLWEFDRVKNSAACSAIEEMIAKAYERNLEGALQKKGWANQAEGGFLPIDKKNGLFAFFIKLTEEGVQHVDRVTDSFFHLVDQLRQSNYSSYLVGASPENPLLDSNLCVEDLAEDLMRKDFFAYPEFGLQKEESISTAQDARFFLEQMDAKNCVSFVMAPFQEMGISPSYIEKWMGSSYVIRKLDVEETKKPIDFDFELPPFAEEEEEDLDCQTSYLTNDRWSIELRASKLDQGRTNVILTFSSPYFSDSLVSAACSEIFVQQINARLEREFSEEFGAARLFVYQGDVRLIAVFINDNAKEGLERLFAILQEKALSNLEFFEAKKAYLSCYEGDNSPIESALDILTSCMGSANYYTPMEVHRYMSNLSYEQYKDWQGKKWDLLFIKGQIEGGISQEEMAILWQDIGEHFPYTAYNPIRESKELLGAQYFFTPTHRKGSALGLVISSESPYEDSLLGSILSPVIEDAFYSELRTNKQLAYQLHSWSSLKGDKLCFYFVLQSPTYSAAELLQNVELFLHEFSQKIPSFLTKERFHRIYRGLLLDFKQGKSEAEEEEYRIFYDRRMQALQNLSFSDAIEAAQNLFLKESYHKLAILVEGRAQEIEKIALEQMGYLELRR